VSVFKHTIVRAKVMLRRRKYHTYPVG